MIVSIKQQNTILELIRVNHPEVNRCSDGHVGESKVVEELEYEEDRFYEVKVSRCSVCGLPDGGEVVE